jgi:hypothetical protein
MSSGVIDWESDESEKVTWLALIEVKVVVNLVSLVIKMDDGKEERKD